jgi:hypothetical protein
MRARAWGGEIFSYPLTPLENLKTNDDDLSLSLPEGRKKKSRAQ